VALDSEVASEFAMVRWLWDQLGLGDRTAMEVFSGEHRINGEETFRCLHHRLNWPEPRQVPDLRAGLARTNSQRNRLVRPSAEATKRRG
jgi:hypothetical protein